MKLLELKAIHSGRHGEIIDFVISGRSLHAELSRRGYDLVPRTSTKLVPTDTRTRELLLLESAGDTPRDRVALYLCPICGGLGCGAITVRINSDRATFTWEDFAIETDYFNEEEDGFQLLKKLGPFRFDAQQYTSALNLVSDSH